MDLQCVVGSKTLIFVYMIMVILINDGGKEERIKEIKSQTIKMFLQKIILKKPCCVDADITNSGANGSLFSYIKWTK